MEIRKMEKKEEVEKKRKRNMVIFSIIMAGILLFSVAGSYLGGNDEEGQATGKVAQVGDEWVFTSGEQTFRFSNPPETAKNVSINAELSLNDYYGKAVYIDSNSPLATTEIASNLARFSERFQEACYGKCGKNLPEKNCTENIIIFSKSENRTIYKNESCVFIEGDLESADAFLYKVLGVI